MNPCTYLKSSDNKSPCDMFTILHGCIHSLPIPMSSDEQLLWKIGWVNFVDELDSFHIEGILNFWEGKVQGMDISLKVGLGMIKEWTWYDKGVDLQKALF